MRNLNTIKISLLSMSVFSAIFAATEVNAIACTNHANNSATLNITNSELYKVGNIYMNNFYTDDQFRYPSTGTNLKCKVPAAAPAAVHTPAYPYTNMLCNDSPTDSGGTTNADYINTANNTSLKSTAYSKTLPAVCALSVWPANYQSSTLPNESNKLTSILYTSPNTTVTAGTVIGLAGAYKVRSSYGQDLLSPAYGNPYSPSRSLRWGKLSLVKDATNGWLIKDEYGILFQLTGVTETVASPGAVAGNPVTATGRKVTVTATGLKFGYLASSFGDYMKNNSPFLKTANAPHTWATFYNGGGALVFPTNAGTAVTNAVLDTNLWTGGGNAFSATVYF